MKSATIFERAAAILRHLVSHADATAPHNRHCEDCFGASRRFWHVRGTSGYRMLSRECEVMLHVLPWIASLRSQ
jgi:hypothetical protein